MTDPFEDFEFEKGVQIFQLHTFQMFPGKKHDSVSKSRKIEKDNIGESEATYC